MDRFGILLIGHTAMVVHHPFCAYVVFGGFLSLRWPRMVWPHLFVVAYALGIVTIGRPCFPTDIENRSREPCPDSRGNLRMMEPDPRNLPRRYVEESFTFEE